MKKSYQNFKRQYNSILVKSEDFSCKKLSQRLNKEVTEFHRRRKVDSTVQKERRGEVCSYLKGLCHKRITGLWSWYCMRGGGRNGGVDWYVCARRPE